MRKKVLIITYYWPPAGGPGVQRALYFVKYLRDFGWEPIVYTVENGEYHNTDPSFEHEIPENVEVLKKPSREPYYWYKLLTGRKKEEKLKPALVTEKTGRPLLQRTAVWIRGNFFIPDARMWWIRPSVRFITGYLKDNPVDAVFSTSPPQSVHLIARNVSRKMNIPWVADFRDPWTKVHYFDDLTLSRRALKKHRILEKSVLTEARRVTAVSWSMAEDFERLSGRAIDVITNGYDLPENLLQPAPPEFDGIKIFFMGSLPEKRNPIQFWEVLKSWIAQNNITPGDLNFLFIGNIDPAILRYLNETGLQDFISSKTYIPHNEIWDYLHRSDVLFFIGTPGKKDVINLKIFEYLAVQKPILSISSAGGDIEKILKETAAGLNADFDQPEIALKNFIRFYEAFQNHTLRHIGSSAKDSVARFSRRNLTRELALLLDEITGEDDSL